MLRHKSTTVLPVDFDGVDDSAAIDRALDRLRAAADHCDYEVMQVDGCTLRIRPLAVEHRGLFTRGVFRVPPPTLRLDGAKLDGEVATSIERDGDRLVCRWRRRAEMVLAVVACSILIFLVIERPSLAVILVGLWAVAEWRDARNTGAWVKAALVWRGPSRATPPPTGAA